MRRQEEETASVHSNLGRGVAFVVEEEDRDPS